VQIIEPSLHLPVRHMVRFCGDVSSEKIDVVEGEVDHELGALHPGGTDPLLDSGVGVELRPLDDGDVRSASAEAPMQGS